MYEPVNLSRFILQELPASCDETTLQLSELLHRLSRHFDHCYQEQLLRAHRARRKHRQRMAEHRSPYGPQSKLPEEFYRRFSPRGRRR